MLMIAKDERLFVVMDALNQVCRRRRMEKLLSHSHDLTGRVEASFSNMESFTCFEKHLEAAASDRLSSIIKRHSKKNLFTTVI